MIHSVKIEGYRGFSHFQMKGLGRINLLVGKNNSGKTSVLEALYFLSSGGDPYALWQLCSRRGERLVDERDTRYGPDMEIDVSHMFTGHELLVGNKFSVSARNQTPERAVTVSVEEPSERERESGTLPMLEGELPRPRVALHIKTTPPSPTRSITLSRRGGVSLDTIDSPSRRPSRLSERTRSVAHFISTESLSADELIRLWDRIQLTPHEHLVLRALRFVDESIDQVRATGATRFYGGRGGFIIKRSNEFLPFPLGSLGDGAWRMLAMAIVITQCANGVLFVDEIDTGLHYTVMADMWRLIEGAAREFNVQVFATTHSYDCVHSLSTICGPEVIAANEVTIQRIELCKPEATPFTAAEIRVAANRQIEVR